MFTVASVRISEVATRSGVAATTLRFYESIGLVVPSRSENGYRSYDESVLERLGLIEAAKQLELSLPEIADLVASVEGDTCTEVRDALRPTLQRRLREVDERLARLQALRERLAAAERDAAACPDSAESCRTECVLLRQRQLDPPESCAGRTPTGANR